MIYLFTGQPGSGKTTLAKKLQFWLQTDKKNWRKSVFQIDGDQLREMFPNTDYSKEGRYKNITKAFDIAKYLDASGNDVVISLVSPYKELREEFKSQCKVQEIYCHTKKIKNPDTGKMIKIKSALQYDKTSKAHKAAEFALKNK